MSGNLFSRLLPGGSTSNPSRSIYEAMEEHDNTSDASDIEERAGMRALPSGATATTTSDFDDRDDSDFDPTEAFTDQEPAPPPISKGPAPADSGTTTSETSPVATHARPHLPQQEPKRSAGAGTSRKPKWMTTGSVRFPTNTHDDGDDEVPQSLLFEGGDAVVLAGLGRTTPLPPRPSEMPVPGPATDTARAQWQYTQQQQALHPEETAARQRRNRQGRGPSALMIIDPKERALWRWANVENLDNFLHDAYSYFLGNGIYSICLSRALNMLTLAFVVGFTTFLFTCVDFPKIPHSKKLTEVLIPQCTKKMSFSASFFLWLFCIFWIAKVFQHIVDIRRLRHLHDFYHYLLDIPDTDIQTISWQDVVAKLMLLRDANPVTANASSVRNRRFLGSQSKQRMDAHDIANRLMRKENYLIAMFNKDVLDLTLPIPFFRNRVLSSRTLEWNLNYCILDFVFNRQGQVRPIFLKDSNRRALSDGLRKRFMFAAFMNVVCAPFIVTYFLLLYFFRYFTEFQKNPSQIGSRQYTIFAEWKFREFNELWHIFERRLNMSYPFAARYIDQFPKDKTVQVGRFVSFIAGALAAVLAVASVIDPELFLGFEITHERTVLFYLGVFGTIWAVARGVSPEENTVFDPEFALRNVIEFTHYMPGPWQDRLHSDDVRIEFSALYQMKIVIFLEEILSMIYTPFLLWLTLPACSDRIIDFFREFTVHVDGLGYVCSFAVFDFKKGGNVIAQHHQARQYREDPDIQGLRDEYYSAKDGKMLASYYGFLDNYGPGGNQRLAAPYVSSSTRQQFQANVPPVHPHPPQTAGMYSQTLPSRRAGMSSGVGLPGAQSMHKTPRFAPTVGGGQSSPPQSLLLDPHHQPSASGFRSLHKPLPRRPVSPSNLLREEPSEDEDVPDAYKDAAAAGTSASQHPESSGQFADEARMPTNDGSHLGESFMTTTAAVLRDGMDDGDEDEDGEGRDAGGGAGVLGLLYQFQKQHTPGRGGAVQL